MSVKAWGCTDFGALGMGDGNDESLLPSEVTKTLESRNVEGIAAGDSHSIAWDSLGNVYSWGRNKEGQLGYRGPVRMATPELVQGLRHERVIGAAAGASHTLCFTKCGSLYAFGAHHERVEDTEVLTFFGRGREMPEHKRRMILKSHVSYFNAEHMEPSLEERPDAPETPDDADSALGGRVAALVEAAQVAGEGVRQEMALPRETGQRSNTFKRVVRWTPWRVDVPCPSAVVAVAAGHCFSAVVTAAGRLITWGYNDKGQLGHGDRLTRDEPEVVRGLPAMATVSCGEQHCVAVAKDGSVWAAGLNVFGQLGLGDRVDRLVFQRLPALDTGSSGEEEGEGASASAEEVAGGEAGRQMGAVACGLYHTCLLSRAGKVLVCGHREYGQQGEATDQGETEDGMGRAQSVVTPRVLDLEASLEARDTGADYAAGGEAGAGAPRGGGAALRVSSIASGALHSMAVTEDGRMVTWGWGGTGSLGHGWGERMGRRFAATPAREVEALRAERVVCGAGGRRHTLALVRSAGRCSLGGDLAALLEPQRAGRWDDVCFRVRGEEVLACRAVVAARCPKLGAMIAFSTPRFSKAAAAEDGEGRQRTEVVLKGVRSASAMRAVVAFLYTDKLEVTALKAREVRVLAQALELPRLQALCQKITDAADDEAPRPGPEAEAAEEDRGQGLGAGLLALREGLPIAADIVLLPSGGAPELPPLYAHKCILAARCEFFATAFDSLFMEGAAPGASGLQPFYLGLDDELAEALLGLEPEDPGAQGEGRAARGKAQWEAMDGVLDFVYGGACGLSAASSYTRCIFTLRLADELCLPDLHEAVEGVLQEKLLVDVEAEAGKEKWEGEELEEEASMAELLLGVAERFSCPRLAAYCRSLTPGPEAGPVTSASGQGVREVGQGLEAAVEA